MKKILVFQHIEREHPSIIAEYAKEKDIELDIIRLWEEVSVPQATGYDALIVLGGPMGAYEEYPNKKEELHALSNAIGTVPVLGICLGSQLLAYALGAPVYKMKAGGRHVKEIGYYGVSLTEAGASDPLFQGFPREFKVLQWHGDTFDLPKDAKLIVTAPDCPNQAFSYGNAYGVQFHIEATPGIVGEWIRQDSTWVHAGFELDEEKTLAEARASAAEMKKYCYRMMDNFLSVA